jgi:2-polyprenyl-3-methyl-5-hydroxy-6-metoxy-1,4-benzoquinol methylase
MGAQQTAIPGVNGELADKMATMAEKITGEYAEHLLRRARPDNLSGDDGSDLVILDEACGTGIVSARLMAMLSGKSRQKLDLTMSDIAQPIVGYAKGRILREGWPVVLTTYTGSGPGQKPA